MHSATFLDQLDHEVELAKADAWAPSTKKTYATHKAAYLRFSRMVGVSPLPANSRHICRYAVYLARTKAFSSVKQYINIIRIMSLEANLPNPLEGDYSLKQVMLGLKRKLGEKAARKLPITKAHLYHIFSKLDISLPLHGVYWGACLTLFYTLLRRSNVLTTFLSFNPDIHLTRKDVSVGANGTLISIKHTKTIQFKQRELTFPLPRLKGSSMCPTRAIYNAIRLVPAGPNQPLFSLPEGKCLSPDTFIKLTREFLSDIVDNTKDYAGHSFRRGGASYLFQLGATVSLIRSLGDWQSDAYALYTLPSQVTISSATHQMGVALQSPP